MNAKLAKIATPWMLKMELARVMSLNAVKVKFAKMGDAFYKIQIQYLIATLISNAKMGRYAKIGDVYQKCVLSWNASLDLVARKESAHQTS